VAYRENHIASAFYLARWAGPDGRVITIRVPTVTGVPRKPRRVGFRANFWGRDPHVRTAMETRIGKIEDLAARDQSCCGSLASDHRQ
jgi:hypothetical protein